MVDVSGTTDAEGKVTRGYDPSQDIVWLHGEIVRWILGNLLERWGSIKRRHMALKAHVVDTMHVQFSGYGATHQLVARSIERAGIKTPLETWGPEVVEEVVTAFVAEKFPTVIALNKIDHADADKNIAKIAKQQPAESLVLCSAISEVFLRKLVKQRYIKYDEGSEFLDTREDLIEQGDPEGGGLREMDERMKQRIENLRDMVLFRFGSTGVVEVLSRAAKLLGLVPVFPVRNIHSFGAGGVGGGEAVFRDCVLVPRGTTVREAARKVLGDVTVAYIEGPGGRVAEDEVVEVGKNDVCNPPVFRQSRPLLIVCRYCRLRSGVHSSCCLCSCIFIINPIDYTPFNTLPRHLVGTWQGWRGRTRPRREHCKTPAFPLSPQNFAEMTRRRATMHRSEKYPAIRVSFAHRISLTPQYPRTTPALGQNINQQHRRRTYMYVL